MVFSPVPKEDTEVGDWKSDIVLILVYILHFQFPAD